MESEILTLTEAASQKIRSLQEQDEERRDMAIRVGVGQDGPAAFLYSLRFVPRDDRREDDTEIEADGVKLYVDPESLPRIRGATLDFVETMEATGFKFDNPNKPPLLQDPLAERVQKLIDERINPAVAQHGGRIALMDLQDGRAVVRFGGGCQGCGMVDVTLKQGVEQMIRSEIPEIREIVDETDHAAGENPYYAPQR